MRSFESLSEQEILALAIAMEEEDSRIYADFAEGLRKNYPVTADIFDLMRKEEINHRQRLFETYKARWGEHIPLIRREDVRGFVKRRPFWLVRPLRAESVRKHATAMEMEIRQFYEQAARHTQDASLRQLLDNLAEEERSHAQKAEELQRAMLPAEVRELEEEAGRRLFVLQVVQPGLAGLIDGSVSTLAPLFAAAFATRSTHDAFAVGLAASVGAGISMGFTEALSDDGTLTGRGHPWIRGVVCGLMTTLGGIGHTLPFLLGTFHTATVIAAIVVVLELAAISFIRYRYMDSPPFSAAVQVMVGGALVCAAGILIGNS
jgi:rubrerythrin